jgi:hypothetical protein
VACAINEHTAFQAPRCCPTCVVNGPNDVIPVPPPPVCHPDECPACPAGQEVLSTDTTCCACQAPPQSCLDGRTQWLAEVNARWSSSAVSCAVDADCVITSVASRCETTCYGAIADAQVAALTTWAAGRADELCASCTTEPPICPGGALTPAVCSMGTCVLTPP